MATTITSLIQKNKKAYDEGFLIESLSLSYILINKALKQIIKNDLQQEVLNQKTKTSFLLSYIRKELHNNPNVKASISKKAMKDIKHFVTLYKEIFKELRFQYPEKKIKDTAHLGINCISMLNTSLVKIKNNAIS